MRKLVLVVLRGLGLATVLCLGCQSNVLPGRDSGGSQDSGGSPDAGKSSDADGAPGTGRHVSANVGSDANDGSEATPFKTIQKCANVAQPGEVCWIHAGTYRETVVPPRSGEPGRPIRFEAWGQDVVVVSGSEPVSGWTVHQGSIWKAPMSADFFSRATPGDGVHLYDPAVFNQADQVFFDQKMVPVARWPNQAAFDFSLPKKSTLTAFVSKSRSSNWTTAVFDDAANDLPASSVVGAEIFIQPSKGDWSWTLSGHVTDKAGVRITARSRSDSGNIGDPSVYVIGSRYYLFNHMALLDTPGEWFHDKAAGVLYFWPPGGANPQGRVEAKHRVFGFNLSKRSFITVSKLRFFACTVTTDDASGGDNVPYDDAGTMRYPWRNAAYGRPKTPYHNPPYNDAPSTDVLVDGIDVLYPTHYTDVSGHYFLWAQGSGVVLSGQRHVLKNSRIRYSSGNGVLLLGRENKAINNVISDVNAMVTHPGCIHTGITDRGSSDHEIAFNTCSRAGKSGILPTTMYDSNAATPSDTRARIHHNNVFDFALQDGDSGALYTGGDGRFLRIDHNWFHDAHPNIDDDAALGNFTVSGVYLDWCKNFIVDHNVIWGVEWAVHLQADVDGQSNHFCYNNTVVSRNFENPWTKYGPFGFVTNSKSQQNGTVLRNNLIFCADGSPGYKAIDTFAAAEKANNLVWDRVDGSSTDPKLQGGATQPDALYLTAQSTAAIDKGSVVSSYTRDGITVPAYNDAVVGAAPDLGALERGAAPWKAGSTAVFP